MNPMSIAFFTNPSHHLLLKVSVKSVVLLSELAELKTKAMHEPVIYLAPCLSPLAAARLDALNVIHI